MAHRNYGIGVPTVLDDIDRYNSSIDAYFGFIKCKVLAPDRLYVPVLPVKYSKKLYFPLCVKCIDEKNDPERDLADKNCRHTDDERALIGTWFSEELKLAVRKGYRVLRIYQVLHYAEQSGDLFKGYINAHLAEKVKASVYDFADDQEAKQRYCQEYKEREGIDIRPEELVPNPGKRAITKLMLNSLWGKYAQRPNQQKTVICKTYEQFRKVMSDSKHIIKGYEEIDENTVLVSFKYVDDKYDTTTQRNVGLAAMVTGYARVMLYEIIDQIEQSQSQRILYCDTDSVIFKHDEVKNWSCPPVGDFLGEMTDEIEKDYGKDAKIISFSSGGPKNYGYIVEKKQAQHLVEFQTVKCKGINLSAAAAETLPYNRIKRHALEYTTRCRQNLSTQNLRKDKVPQLRFRSDR